MSQQSISKRDIHLDLDLCIGAGMCESVASGAFVVNDDGLVALGPDFDQSEGPLGPELLLAAEEAAAVCPARAIRVGDEG